MQKSFDSWNERKKSINDLVFSGYFHEREIWWCSLGMNIGDEEDGKNEFFERPVLVIKKFNRDIALIVPLTTKLKDNKYYLNFTHEEIQYAVILSQLRLVSSKRFRRRIRKINQNLFNIIREQIIEVSI